MCVCVYFVQVESDAESFLVTLSFAFSLLGRRMFFQHAQSGSSRRGSVAMVTVSRIRSFSFIFTLPCPVITL